MGALVTEVQTCALPSAAGQRAGPQHRAAQVAAPGLLVADPVEDVLEHRLLGFRIALEAQVGDVADHLGDARSEEHTSELQSLMRISYAVFCLKKKKKKQKFK